MVHPKLLAILQKLQLASTKLPSDQKKWELFLKNTSILITELSERLELAENTLSVAALEMDTLYGDLKRTTDSELDQTNINLLASVNDNKRLLAFSESILEASTDGILVVNHASGKILRSNQRFMTMWQIAKELSEDTDFETVFSSVYEEMAQAEQFKELVSALALSQETESYDSINFRDGRVFNCYSLPLRQDAQNSARVWFFRDVTEVITKERQITEQRSQLINATKMSSLGEMSSGIAHEINNPLGVIQGRAIQLIRWMKSGNFEPEKGLKYLENIFAESERIAKIIKGLVAFARNGEKDPFVPVNIADILNDVFSLCSERFKNNSVELTITSSPDILIEGRATQLAQVMSNLINNAFDAISNLSEKWVRVEVHKVNKQIHIMITDSGPGIPPHVVEKMMQPFFTTKPIGKGTGLGLSISSGIVEDHHGVLKYDASCSHTRFIIELPISQAELNLEAA